MLTRPGPAWFRDLLAYEANLQARLRETARRHQAEQQFAVQRINRRIVALADKLPRTMPRTD